MRSQARGHRSELRIGYLLSAAQSVLSPALDQLRLTHPDLILKLHDMSPREQIDGLRSGELDVALIGQEGAMAAGDFHSTTLCSLEVCTALASTDPLASREKISVGELKDKAFIGIDEREMPGRNRWMTSLCRTAGFKPRFVVITDGITAVLSQVVSESAVTLLPAYFLTFNHPGVTFVPVSNAEARWDLFLLWQRGKVPATTRALVDALKSATQSLCSTTPFGESSPAQK